MRYKGSLPFCSSRIKANADEIKRHMGPTDQCRNICRAAELTREHCYILWSGVLQERNQTLAGTKSNSPNKLRLQRHGFHLTRWNNGTSVHNTPSPVFLMVTHILFKIICLIQSSKIRNYQYPYFILKFLCKIRYKFCSNLTSTGTRYIPLWFISTTQSGSWTWLLLVAKKRN